MRLSNPPSFAPLRLLCEDVRPEVLGEANAENLQKSLESIQFIIFIQTFGVSDDKNDETASKTAKQQERKITCRKAIAHATPATTSKFRSSHSSPELRQPLSNMMLTLSYGYIEGTRRTPTKHINVETEREEKEVIRKISQTQNKEIQFISFSLEREGIFLAEHVTICSDASKYGP